MTNSGGFGPRFFVGVAPIATTIMVGGRVGFPASPFGYAVAR